MGSHNDRRPGFKYCICALLAVWPWLMYSVILCLSLLTCKIGNNSVDLLGLFWGGNPFVLAQNKHSMYYFSLLLIRTMFRIWIYSLKIKQSGLWIADSLTGEKIAKVIISLVSRSLFFNCKLELPFSGIMCYQTVQKHNIIFWKGTEYLKWRELSSSRRLTFWFY